VTGLSVIGTNCRIGANATLADCILEEGVIVEDGASLAGVILDNGARVESDVVVRAPAVFAAGSFIAKGTRITAQ
jgi:ADP-glucose pyrophosphorylase